MASVFVGSVQQQPHRFHEGHAAYLDEKVDGVARLSGVGTDPVVFFYYQIARFSNHSHIAVLQRLKDDAHGREQRP